MSDVLFGDTDTMSGVGLREFGTMSRAFQEAVAHQQGMEYHQREDAV